MSNLIKFIKLIDLTDYILLIPSVSVGNVPQLTIDIIIATHNLQRTGIIWHPAIVPSVGGDPFKKNSSELTTACELYTNEELKLAVIQMRSTVEPKYAVPFFELLLNGIKALKFKMLVILTSAFAQEMHNVQSGLFRYLSSGDTVPSDLLADKSGNITQGTEDELHAGTGFALKLHKLAVEKSVNSIIIAKYTSEGDNRPDAVQMLAVLYKLFKNFNIDENELTVKFPTSWDHVFGNPPPMGIY